MPQTTQEQQNQNQGQNQMQNPNQGQNQMQNPIQNPTQGQNQNQQQNQARETFVAVQKNGDGDITAFQTSGGRKLDYPQALQEVKSGAIQGVNAFKGKDGEMYIRGDADGDPSNNLDNLPTFSINNQSTGQ